MVDSRRKVARHPGSKMCLFSRQNQYQSIAWSTRLQPAAPPARCGMELRVAPPRSSACTGGTCSTAGAAWTCRGVLPAPPKHIASPQTQSSGDINIDNKIAIFYGVATSLNLSVQTSRIATKKVKEFLWDCSDQTGVPNPYPHPLSYCSKFGYETEKNNPIVTL